MILVFETHPVQYRAPLYREIHRLAPHSFEVIYGCFSPGFDSEFNRNVKWDSDLLEGYPHTVLDNKKDDSLNRPSSLSGEGVWKLLETRKPRAVLQTSLRYYYDFSVWAAACARGIPLWLRCETQDEAFVRNPFTSLLREEIYHWLYQPFRRAFYFGELNRRHLLRHGFSREQLTFTPYVVPNPLIGFTPKQRRHNRQSTRASLQIAPEASVIGFFGKLIPKKNPELLLEVFKRLVAKNPKKRWELVFVGSGPEEAELRRAAGEVSSQVHFAGFINQATLASYYLAVDILVLPSRRQGETWGLVVNEGLQAGCSVVVSDAVGCHPEFSHLPRFRVFPDENAGKCLEAIEALADQPFEPDWARETTQTYSIQSVAETLAEAFTGPDPVHK